MKYKSWEHQYIPEFSRALCMAIEDNWDAVCQGGVGSGDFVVEFSDHDFVAGVRITPDDQSIRERRARALTNAVSNSPRGHHFFSVVGTRSSTVRFSQVVPDALRSHQRRIGVR